MTTIYGKDGKDMAKRIVSAIKEVGRVCVHSTYETFYGHAMDGWIARLCKANGFQCEVVAYDRFEGFASEWIIEGK